MNHLLLYDLNIVYRQNIWTEVIVSTTLKHGRTMNRQRVKLIITITILYYIYNIVLIITIIYRLYSFILVILNINP